MKRAPKAETGLQAAIVAALALEPGLVIWRNSNGTFRAHGHVVRAGLPRGSADLVGVLTTYAKVPDHYTAKGSPVWVGDAISAVGRFVALEVKRPSEKPEPHQVEWLADVAKRGGFACVVRSVDDARAAIAAARGGASTWEARP